MPIVKTFSVKQTWKHRQQFENLNSKELRKILEKYWVSTKVQK